MQPFMHDYHKTVGISSDDLINRKIALTASTLKDGLGEICCIGSSVNFN